MFDKVDFRIRALVEKLAGDKLDIVLIAAEDLVKEGKMPERALADALQRFKL